MWLILTENLIYFLLELDTSDCSVFLHVIFSLRVIIINWNKNYTEK